MWLSVFAVFAFMLPVPTLANEIVYGSGHIEVKITQLSWVILWEHKLTITL